eukprot:CAMPEP_0171594972 /NCGR_PEP_ID=MMETSP0990-20121206/1038_1 /TAXON_ID=483369 /ORGANISM="non described non described, Strain CCMP2098" /LENGTH=48 /DNA_ID= /DNA_START= /DNA_END= /DNA_ORIENTATION=
MTARTPPPPLKLTGVPADAATSAITGWRSYWPPSWPCLKEGDGVDRTA